MQIHLSDNFNFKKLLKFTFPSVIMLVVSSIYCIVDGFFVSNFVGKTAFAAVNFIMPFLLVLGCIGIMFGTGGSAIIAKTMGEGNPEEANKQFSLIVYFSIIIGLILTVIGFFAMRPIAQILGASGQLLDDCVKYGRVSLISLPAFILQYEFEVFFVTAEKPRFGLYFMISAGVTNMVLDALFVGILEWGIVGASVATSMSEIVGGYGPLIYFFRKNKSKLHLTKTSFKFKVIAKATTNGFSELLSNVSASVVGMLYNMQLMHYAGEDGVAAYGVLMYVTYMFSSMFIGYSVGVAPVISYKYGAKSYDQLKGLKRTSLKIISITGLSMFALSQLIALPLGKIFVGYDPSLFDMTYRAFRIYSFSFLFVGFSIFASSFFTALNNGVVSSIISLLRTFIFQVAIILVLPLFLKTDGIWLSGVIAEVCAFIVSVLFIHFNRKKYRY